ncbi:hypothetical protein MMC13_007062 [Lambiella insularis]|nr:hypothetical protein [Lambiella insularis]
MPIKWIEAIEPVQGANLLAFCKNVAMGGAKRLSMAGTGLKLRATSPELVGGNMGKEDKANLMELFRKNGAPDPGDATETTDPGVQTVPASAKADNTFSNGAAEIIGGFPYEDGTIPDLYQPREIDIPFARLFHGNLMMFPEGQLNQPGFNTDQYTPNVYDFANQSACGIPDNSYVQMKVAIHPYFLKYAGLDHVCVSFWPEGSYTNDMIAKVTDICSIDPTDPSHCASPSDIKVDRAKVQVMYNIPVPGSANAALQADKYINGTYWHLTKCWGNALPQPAYRDNWWAQPPLPNNFQWDVDATGQQMQNNQQSYPARGWATYPDGTSADAQSEADIVPINDWVPGQEPAWAPIAGGMGFGTPQLSKGPPAGSGVAGVGTGAGAGAGAGWNATGGGGACKRAG